MTEAKRAKLEERLAAIRAAGKGPELKVKWADPDRRSPRDIRVIGLRHLGRATLF